MTTPETNPKLPLYRTWSRWWTKMMEEPAWTPQRRSTLWIRIATQKSDLACLGQIGFIVLVFLLLCSLPAIGG